MTINVKQIFEDAMLNESMGNLNVIKDEQAKDAIKYIMKDSHLNNSAHISLKSRVENVGSYHVNDISKGVKKLTTIGKSSPVSVIVLSSYIGATVLIIKDARYISSGVIDDNTKVIRIFKSRYEDSINPDNINFLKAVNDHRHKVGYAGDIVFYAILGDSEVGEKKNKRYEKNFIEGRGKDINYDPSYSYGNMPDGRLKVLEVEKSSLLDFIVGVTRFRQTQSFNIGIRVGGEVYYTETHGIFLDIQLNTLEELAKTRRPQKIGSIRTKDMKLFSVFIDKNFKLLVKYAI